MRSGPAAPCCSLFIRLLILGWSVLSLAAVVLALSRMEIDRAAMPEAGTRSLAALRPWWLASALAWASLTAFWWFCLRRDEANHPSARGHPALAAGVILIIAAAARLAVLFTHEPALSDDVYRYVLDGRNLAAGVNPYLDAPADRLGALAAGEPERWRGEGATLALVNSPDLHTVYLPASQWSFAVVARIIGESAGVSADARALRAAFAAADLGVILVILLILRRAGSSPWWAALYAWHPLPLTEFAGSGHQDSLGIALVLAALWIAAEQPSSRARSIAVVSLAAMVKPVALAPAALALRSDSWRRRLLAASLVTAGCLLLAAPLWLSHGGEPLANWLAAASRFGLKWAHFGSVYEPLLWLIARLSPDSWTNDHHERLARLICLGLVALAFAVIWRSRVNLWAGARAILFAMVLFSSTAHPWYLLWAMALVPVVPSGAVWIASLTLPWGYAVLGDPADHGVPRWLSVAAYAPVYLALAVGLWRWKRRSMSKDIIA